MKPLSIDKSKCDLCGLCTMQCSNGKLILSSGNVIITDSDKCIACGHCYAICPKAAILPQNGKAPDRISEFQISSDEFMNIIRARRSNRSYTQNPISDDIINKLADFGRYAPTGSNSQSVNLIFIKDKNTIKEILNETIKVYKRFLCLLNIPLSDCVVPLFHNKMNVSEMKTALKSIIKDHSDGIDPIYFAAPLIVYICANKGEASTPYDDCCYAAYNMILGAQTMGISSCINTRALVAVFHNDKIKNKIGLTKGLKPYVCVVFGYPKYKYKSLVFRNEAKIKIL